VIGIFAAECHDKSTFIKAIPNIVDPQTFYDQCAHLGLRPEVKEYRAGVFPNIKRAENGLILEFGKRWLFTGFKALKEIEYKEH
jgi:hypothetical protein